MPQIFSSRRLLRAAFIASAVAGLVACESESSPTGPGETGELTLNQIVTTAPINAKSTDTLVYFSLAANAVVRKTSEWDIALRRYEVRLNSLATAGAEHRGVTAYSMGNNRGLTDAEILALTVESTRSAFDAIRESAIPADAEFRSETLIDGPNAYLNLGGVPTANASAYWKVKTTGGFAIARVSSIALSPTFRLGTVTIESRVENGTTLGATQTLVVTLASAPVYVNLTQNATVTPNGCNWDWQINPNTFDITTNAACSVGTYPGGSAPTFANQTRAGDAPQYVGYLSSLSPTIPNSVTDVEAPFRYNIDGNQRLHPVFNTYLIKSGTRVYKLQLINYYDAGGASGSPTLRYARIK